MISLLNVEDSDHSSSLPARERYLQVKEEFPVLVLAPESNQVSQRSCTWSVPVFFFCLFFFYATSCGHMQARSL